MGRPGLHWKWDFRNARNEWPALSPQLWYISSLSDRLVNLSNVAFSKKTNTVDKCEGPTTSPPIGSLATWAILPSKENSPLYLQGKSFWLILQGFAHSKLTVSPCCTVNGWRGKCFPSHHVETTSQKGRRGRGLHFSNTPLMFSLLTITAKAWTHHSRQLEQETWISTGILS